MTRLGIRKSLVIAPSLVSALLMAGPAAHAEPALSNAPALHLEDVQGNKVSVDYAESRATLVNFWAIWCLPCRTEMPQIDRLYGKYRNRGLEAVGVAVESGDRELVKRFVESQVPVAYKVLMGTSETTDSFGPVTIVPTTYLIGPGGEVISTHVGVTHDFEETLEAEIQAALGAARETRKAAAPPEPGKQPQLKLSPVEKKVVEALLGDWSESEHLTSVDLVMRNLGVSASKESRINLGKYVRDTEGLHEVLESYGPITAILSREEKMMIRALLARQQAGEPIPTIQELSGLTGTPAGGVPTALEILEALDFLEPYPEGQGVGMRVRESLVGYLDPMDLAATTVTLPGKQPFGISSLPKFLRNMVLEPPPGRVVVDGLCSHCVSKIRIVFQDGKVALPTSAALLLGGGSYDALFLSKAHLDQWLAANPSMDDLPRLELTRFVDSLHEQPEIVRREGRGAPAPIVAAR